LEWAKVAGVKKTKAHRTSEEAKRAGEELEHRMNEFADSMAKRAVRRWPGAYEEYEEQRIKRVRMRLNMLADIMSELDVQAAGQVGRRPVEKKTRAAHQWRWADGFNMWRCIVCNKGLRASTTLARWSAGARSTCRGIGLPGSLADAGHRLRIYQHPNDGPLLVVCERCGHYGQQRLSGLGKKCEGIASKQKGTLKFFGKGRHPKTKAQVERRGPVPSSWFSGASSKSLQQDAGAVECDGGGQAGALAVATAGVGNAVGDDPLEILRNLEAAAAAAEEGMGSQGASEEDPWREERANLGL
jgi:hypothetical protein